MCSTPKMPKAPAPPPPAPVVSDQNQQAQAAGEDERRRRALAGGRKSTMLTGPSGQGTGSGTQQARTLLGN